MTNVVMWITNNWAVIVGLIALAVAIGIAIRTFIKLPTSAQKEKVRKCLLAWVIQAERELGGGTGKVKLSTVYGTFVTAFPILKNFISFETFSEWVDDALDEMRKLGNHAGVVGYGEHYNNQFVNQSMTCVVFE